ncbi:MAG: twin-arginine translocase TatA/TatE family subunit [Chloroflexota bacterium]
MSDVALVLILLIVLALLARGPKTLPKLGAALGRGVREARREAQELTDGRPVTNVEEEAKPQDAPAPNDRSRTA